MAVRTITDEQIKWAVEQYHNKKTSVWIAQQLKMNDETIRKWLKRSGIVMRESRVALAAPLNDDFFEIIDDEMKAYWLGYLVADACIGKSAGSRRSLRFYIAAKDKWAIETFANDINYGGKLQLPATSRGQYGICFNSQQFCDHLINHGYLEWKEYGAARLLNSIPDNLFHHFVRGFFDGNGCITYQKRKNRKIGMSFSVTIVAHKQHHEVMDVLNKRLINLVGLSDKPVKIRDTCLSIGWNGNQQVARFGEWLYSDATRFLVRKKARFTSLQNHLGAFDFTKLQIKQIGIDEYKPFLDAYHYLKCGGRRGYTLGLFIDNALIGVAMIGSITRSEMAKKQNLNSDDVRELARFCIHPDYHFKNIPTWFLSRLVKKYKSEYPNIKLLISFADTTRGHEGTIYKAANWKFDGFTHRSYHYVDSNMNEIHKKTVYGLAKKLGITEREYMTMNGLQRVPHKKKRRFLFEF